jgi:hypothetical protein
LKQAKNTDDYWVIFLAQEQALNKVVILVVATKKNLVQG